MAAIHTIVEPNRPLPTPHFTNKPSFTATTTNKDGFTPFKSISSSSNHDEEEDIDDDEDDDDLDDEDDELDESSFSSYHLSRPTTPNNNNNNNNIKPTNPPTNNNYLSINHIISPTNTSHSSIQSPLHQKKKGETQTSTTIGISSGNESQDNISQQGKVKKQDAQEDNLDLLKENRQLRKKMEGLMGHNMQLMLAIKERDHKIYKQKRLLVKYRKALLRFFEENETSSSSDEDLANMSPNEAKATSKKEAKLDAHLRNTGNMSSTPTTLPLIPIPHQPSLSIPPPLTTITTPPPPLTTTPASSASIHASVRNASPPASPASPLQAFPSPYQDSDKDDESAGDFDFDSGKKRKNGVGDFGELEPDKKRRGPRRNALWTAEDDEMFQKVYNVYGKSWKTIHNYMPGKTREQVQSHGQYLIRIGKLEDVKAGPRRGRKGKKEKDKPSSPNPASSHQSSHHYAHSSSHHSSHSSHSHSSHSHHHTHQNSQPSSTHPSPALSLRSPQSTHFSSTPHSLSASPLSQHSYDENSLIM